MTRKHFILKLIISIVLASDIQIALAADVTTTKYDTPENRASLGLNEDWIPDSENYMRQWIHAAEIQKVVLKADAAYKAGNYRAALKFLKSVGDSPVGNARLYYQVKAKCLAHLKQEQGALAAVENTDDLTRREVYRLLGLQVASMSFLNGLSPAHRLLVRIELLVKHDW